MRGDDEQTSHMFSYLSPESRVRADHPLRAIRRMTDVALREISPALEGLYSSMGRPSIPPEQLLRALVIQVLYSVRSERLLMEEIDYSVLYRWFIGLNLDDRVWSATTFSKNRDRLLRGDIAGAFFAAVLRQADAAGLLSDEHFTVDGTMLEAWASVKRFQPKDAPPPDDPDRGNPTVDFRGQRRRNDTHASRTDPDARLYRKTNGDKALLGMCSSRIAMGWCAALARRRPMASASATARSSCSRRAAGAAARSGPTRAMTSRPLSSRCGRWASRRTSRRSARVARWIRPRWRRRAMR